MKVILAIGGIGLLIAAFVGWVLNIIQIAAASAFSGYLVLKVIGVFIPVIGAICGYIG